MLIYNYSISIFILLQEAEYCQECSNIRIGWLQYNLSDSGIGGFYHIAKRRLVFEKMLLWK